MTQSLTDGFEGYLTPSHDEVSAAVLSGLIVLDTNVLLELYTHDPSVRSTALEILRGARDRVWVPHQVVKEFWRNRLSRIAQVTRRADKVAEARESILAAANLLRPYGNRVSDPDEVKRKVVQKLDEIEDLFAQARGVPFDAHAMINDTRADEVLSELSGLLEGRIGPPLDPDDESALIKVAGARAAARIPPGYADEGKSSSYAAGDFLLWEQTLRHLESEPHGAVVLVTQDSKSDWRVSHPLTRAPLGPHPALVQEALQRTGAHLHLLRSEEFYRLAGPLFSIESRRTESLAEASATQVDARQLTWLQAAEIAMAENAPDEWWSPEEIVEAVTSSGLRDTSSAKTPVQTLRRDLNSYGHRRFVKDGSLYRLKRDDELDQPPLI